MNECAPKSTPYSTVTLLPPRLVKTDTAYDFQTLLGKLIWLTNTRPDIMFPVGVLCRYMSSYDENVWIYAKSILKYLKGTTNYGIVYKINGSQHPEYGKGITMSGQVDSDWGGRIEDSKSTTGMTISLNDVCIYAQSKIQGRPALSTAEAETNGSEQLVRNIEWYRNFLMELQIHLRTATPVSQDNTTTLRLTEDCIMQARTKYYRITQHYLRYMVSSNTVRFEYRPSKSMWCDALNKGISYPQFSQHIEPLMGDQKSQ